MENDFPKNRPSRCAAVRVNRAQFDHIFSDAAVAKGDEIAKSLATLKDDIAPAADKRFVLFKNKFLWFDRDVSALFPRMEKKIYLFSVAETVPPQKIIPKNEKALLLFQ